MKRPVGNSASELKRKQERLCVLLSLLKQHNGYDVLLKITHELLLNAVPRMKSVELDALLRDAKHIARRYFDNRWKLTVRQRGQLCGGC